VVTASQNGTDFILERMYKNYSLFLPETKWRKLCRDYLYLKTLYLLLRSHDSSVSIVTRLPAGRAGIPGRGRECFLFATSPRLSLGPTQLLTQWVPGSLSPGCRTTGEWRWPLTAT